MLKFRFNVVTTDAQLLTIYLEFLYHPLLLHINCCDIKFTDLAKNIKSVKCVDTVDSLLSCLTFRSFPGHLAVGEFRPRVRSVPSALTSNG